MFRIGNTIVADEIATARFACDVSRCKGACCVVGESGAPVSREEIPVIKKAYRLLSKELRDEAVEEVEKNGLIRGDKEQGYEIGCVESGECVFVNYNSRGEAECSIQKAYIEKRLNWEKPVSCHLYPVRLKKIGTLEYANFEYIPDICSAGCENGQSEGVFLADFLEKALVRRYGQEWFDAFREHCKTLQEREA